MIRWPFSGTPRTPTPDAAQLCQLLRENNALLREVVESLRGRPSHVPITPASSPTPRPKLTERSVTVQDRSAQFRRQQELAQRAQSRTVEQQLAGTSATPEPVAAVTHAPLVILPYHTNPLPTPAGE